MDNRTSELQRLSIILYLEKGRAEFKCSLQGSPLCQGLPRDIKGFFETSAGKDLTLLLFTEVPFSLCQQGAQGSRRIVVFLASTNSSQLEETSQTLKCLHSQGCYICLGAPAGQAAWSSEALPKSSWAGFQLLVQSGYE